MYLWRLNRNQKMNHIFKNDKWSVCGLPFYKTDISMVSYEIEFCDECKRWLKEEQMELDVLEHEFHAFMENQEIKNE